MKSVFKRRILGVIGFLCFCCCWCWALEKYRAGYVLKSTFGSSNHVNCRVEKASSCFFSFDYDENNAWRLVFNENELEFPKNAVPIKHQEEKEDVHNTLSRLFPEISPISPDDRFFYIEPIPHDRGTIHLLKKHDVKNVLYVYWFRSQKIMVGNNGILYFFKKRKT